MANMSDANSAVPMLRMIVEYADVDSGRKQNLLSKLSDGRFANMTYDDAADLLDVMNSAQDKLENSILDTNDPDLISELTDMKAFVNETLYEAEMRALQAGSAQLADQSLSAKEKYDPQTLLDKLAGLSE